MFPHSSSDTKNEIGNQPGYGRIMTQPENDGIAYLMALKRNAGSAAAAPARESNSAAASLSSPPGPEKRRSARYKCEGSAEMREAGCDVRTWATFTDISLHGCYVEAQATYPVGTVLHLRLESNGIRVEATGNVRVSYPYLGMGIAFVDITEENRLRLKELLASILRPSKVLGPGIPSSLPGPGPLKQLPEISDARAALQALLDFFGDRPLLLRDEFVRILRQSQSAHSIPDAQPRK
jgi:hypothetical protein